MMRVATGTRHIGSRRTLTLPTAPGCMRIFIPKRETPTTPATGTAAPPSRLRLMRSLLNGSGLPHRCWLDREGSTHEAKGKENRDGRAGADRVATAHAGLRHAHR